jgi:hypothetical protein
MAGESLYGVHPSVRMVQKAILQLKDKTGRSLEEWIEYINSEGPATDVERRDWLKEKHGIGTNYAWWLADWSQGQGKEDGDPEKYLAKAEEYVAAMYSGVRAALKPIHDELYKLGRTLGPDVKLCPCQTIVPMYRNNVFAQIKPATNKRIDLGFALKATPGTGRLIDTGGFAKKNRITHRIPLESVDEIDDEVRDWLKTAYHMDAK